MLDQIAKIAKDLGCILEKREWLVVTAESCTGGAIASAITGVPKASSWFERGFVTYSNDAKEQLLGVSSDTLATTGAVSAETAAEMAMGALKNSKADISLAVTGIAGPSGGTQDKPVGTVWFGLAGKNFSVQTVKALFTGDRISIRQQATMHGLFLLKNCAEKY
jgi:nicotinamide-nucleotide amidase